MHKDGNLGSLTIHAYKSAHEAALFLARAITDDISKAYVEGKSVLFLSSGGSSFEVLNHIPGEALGKNLTIGVLDERHDPTNKNSNFAQLMESSFYEGAELAGCSFIDTTTRESQTAGELADFFEKSLRDWRMDHPGGVIIATIGIGRDGHIAGIMPFPENPRRFDELFNSDRWVAAYNAGEKSAHPARVTTTFAFISLIDRPYVFAAGREKRHILERLEEMADIAEIPAHFLKRLRGGLYTDQKLL